MYKITDYQLPDSQLCEHALEYKVKVQIQFSPLSISRGLSYQYLLFPAPERSNYLQSLSQTKDAMLLSVI